MRLKRREGKCIIPPKKTTLREKSYEGIILQIYLPYAREAKGIPATENATPKSELQAPTLGAETCHALCKTTTS